ncbi:tetratricopeptide repeat protein [Coprobacter tertius]|uniref:Tetratricopeptide repeat protein n=1 Tax=Coprobacter tertius TaxID=2944915 RepID=A0ABT1MI77_9BACT|nr:tetratricopeptide repeat protein [Coprobacter tertius]MCP9612074.1 tetratricopeptide repeat protein [Coprobacter tertius]
MSKKEKSGLLARYEFMLEHDESCYFDTDEWEEIAYQYEIDDKYQEALEAINRGLSMHPGNIALNIKKSRYLMSLDNIDEAEELIYSIPHDSEDAVLIRAELCFIKAKPEEAVRLLHGLLKSDEISVELCFEIMDMYIDFGYFEDLVTFIYEADKVLSDGSELLRELALMYEDRQELDKAEELYNLLIDRNPYSAVDWFNLAKINAINKEYEKAIDACDFALTVNDGDENILSFKGYCLYDLGEYEKAIEVFDEYARISDEKAVAYELMSECYVKLLHYDIGIEYLKKALEYSPDNTNLYYQLATDYYDIGNREKAFECLLKAIKLEPNDADALSFMGEILIDENKLEQAESFLRKSIEIDATNAEAFVLLGDIMVREEKYEESVSCYEKARKITPYDVKLIFKLTLSYYNIGAQDKAEELIKYLEESTSHIDEIPDIPEENKSELLETKEMLEQLREILKNNLGENL